MIYGLFVSALKTTVRLLPPSAERELKRRFGPALERLRSSYGSPRPADEALPSSVMPDMRIQRYDLALADLDAEELRSLVASLNDQAETLGCVVFEGRRDSVGTAVVFAGNVERFFMLPVARHLECKVVYFQDLRSGWYQGSDVLPDLQALCQTVLREEVADQPCLFFGQSSGAYAALAASAFFPNATAVACAPQSFADAALKNRVHFVGVRCLQTPPGLLDLRKALRNREASDTLHAIVIAASEAGNPYMAHFWMDYLHALRLLDLPTVQLSVVKADNHAIVHGRLNLFADLLKDLMTQVFASPDEKSATIVRFLQVSFP